MPCAQDVIKVVEERGSHMHPFARDGSAAVSHVEGWHAVNWMEGFTLLHWAAEKGLADFCRLTGFTSGRVFCFIVSLILILVVINY